MLRCACMLLGVFLGLGNPAPAQTVKWTFATEGTAQAPTLFPSAEKPQGVVIAAGNKITVLDGKGEVRWSTDLTSSVTQPVTVSDSGAQPTLFAVLSDGSIACLDETGKVLWSTSLHAEGFALTPVAADGTGQIVIGRSDGWVFCLDNTGDVLWRFFGDRFRASAPAVGDVDGDGAAEIVFATDNGHAYCLRGDGRVKWRWTGGMPFGRTGVNLADLTGDGKVEVLLARSNAGRDCGAFALEGATGKMLWHAPTEMQQYISLAATDLDGDGTLETIHGDKGNFLYCTNADGAERWRKELSGRGIFCAPTIGDVDGDGKPEILAGVRDNDPVTGASHFLVRADGSEATPVKLGGGGSTATAMGDMDGDGSLEVLAATPGSVQCLNWGGKGKVLWASLRGNSAMNGRVSMATAVQEPTPPPQNVPELTLALATREPGTNTLGVSWSNPAPAGAFLETTVAIPGYSETRVGPVKQGATSTNADILLTPTPESAPISARLFAPEGTAPLAVGQISLESGALLGSQDVPNTLADLDRLAQSLRPRQRSVLNQRVAQLSDMLQRSRQTNSAAAAPRGSENSVATTMRWTVRQRAGHLADRVRRLGDQSKTLFGALKDFWESGGSGSFVCWEDQNPWDAFDAQDVPDGFEPSPAIHITAFGDEFEDVALSILNISDRPVEVRCVFSKPKLAGGAPDRDPDLARHITLRRGLMVPAPNGGMVLDALPELDLSRTVTLSPLEASQLWLVVDTHGLAAGSHTLTLYLGSLEEEITQREIPLTIEVLPVRLPEGVYAQMNWVGTDIGETSDQQLKDMLDHGISVAYGPRLPALPVNAEGIASATPDWTSFDTSLDRLPPWFQVTFAGPPTAQWPAGHAPAADSAEANRAFAEGVRVLAGHLSEQGWGYDRWMFYPYDEPWLTGSTIIADLRGFCERVKAADPRARMYADPTGLMRVERVAEFKDLIDVWQPEINVLKRDPELLAWFQQHSGTLWAYEATDPGKELLPLGYYRAHAWMAWKLGLKGAGFWCYKYNDAWWPLDTVDWSVVYQTGDAVTPSRRWEACRDGQEDYRALHALRDEADKARAAGRMAAADKAAAAIKDLVEQTLDWQFRNIDEITRQTRGYEIDFGLLQKNRARIAEEIMALRAEETGK